jgi:hypothetical protein
MKSFLAMLVFTLASLVGPRSLEARSIALRFGPLSSGVGGTNPVGLPPSLQDLGISYLTKSEVEFNGSLTGMSVAKRHISKWGGYVSLGGGLAISSFGSGFGPYAGFGFEGACLFKTCFTAEYQQMLGVAAGTLISPYSVRIGAAVWF